MMDAVLLNEEELVSKYGIEYGKLKNTMLIYQNRIAVRDGEEVFQETQVDKKMGLVSDFIERRLLAVVEETFNFNILPKHVKLMM